MEVKLKKFRNLWSNVIIISMLMIVFAMSYAGTTLKAFSSGDGAIYHGNLSNNNISLMINVYWGNEYIDGILEELKKENIKTTFFIGGMWAEKYPEILTKIIGDGHEIGNHGYFHKDHDKISVERNKEEILVTNNLIKEQTGIDMNLFAPPSGAYNKTTLDIASSLGYKTIMWTRDTIDWRDKDANLIYNRAVKNINNGDLILMHPTEKTLEALPKIIKTIKEKGFQIVCVSKNLEEI